jgi:hypothetical protein
MKVMRIFALLAVTALSQACASEDNVGSDSEAATPKASELSVLFCRSSQECPSPTHCSTEDGVCRRPPGCKPGSICPDVCYGTCVLESIDPTPVPLPGVCGDKVCGKGTFCCNSSCGTCAPLGGACTQQICTSPI